MTDWNVALIISAAGFGTNLVVLLILLLVVWGIGLLAQRYQRRQQSGRKNDQREA